MKLTETLVKEHVRIIRGIKFLSMARDQFVREEARLDQSNPAQISDALLAKMEKLITL